MGSGFSKMKKQAKLFEQQISKAQEMMKQQEVEGSSGSGLVKVKLNGEKELLKVTINPECVDPTDVEALEDLIQAAFSDATAKISNQSNPVADMPAGFPFGI